MIAYEQVPQTVKDEIITIISRDGFDEDSLGVCASGLMIEDAIQRGMLPADAHDNLNDDDIIRTIREGNYISQYKSFLELAAKIYINREN